MDPVDAFSRICLIAFGIFALFWLITPAGTYYETVDRVWMQKKSAFGICALVMLAGWLYSKTF